MDFQRAKAAQNAEQDSHKEEDIDISEEAQSFRPIRINRDEPDSKEGNPQQDNAENPESENEILILTVQRNLYPNQNLPDTFTGRPS